MLWSLIKILAFVAAITGLTYGAVMISDMEGSLVLTFAGIKATLSPLQVVFALLAMVVGLWILFKLVAFLAALFRFLNGDETAISRYFTRNRERKGFEALSDGLMALASGEGHLALTKAAKAERFLQRPELTNLLIAQAAEQVGDRAKAEATYKKLLEDDKTRFVGIRGIMKQKLSEGDKDKALKLAEKAFELKPKHSETQDILLKLQAEKGDWSGARLTLGAKLKSGTLPREVHKRRDAVLALSEAKDVIGDESTSINSREAAIEANKLSPDLIPAAVMAARAYIEAANPKNATRVITKAWKAQPHPDLARAFAEIAPNETPQERLKRFKSLAKLAPDNAETKLVLAELNVAAEDFPEARRELGTLAQDDPTTRSLSLMAAIERGSGANDQVVRGWLAKAVTAPRGPQWICDKCHHIHPEWQPVCDNCTAFDTLSWKRPPQGETAIPSSAEMLPLIVGAPEPDDVDDEIVVAGDTLLSDQEK